MTRGGWEGGRNATALSAGYDADVNPQLLVPILGSAVTVVVLVLHRVYIDLTGFSSDLRYLSVSVA